MFMIIKRKHITVAICVLFILTLMVVINIPSENSNEKTVQYENKSDSSLTPVPQTGQAIAVAAYAQDNISQAKNDRDIARSKVCEFLRETIENENSSVNAKEKAENELLNIASQMDAEIKCETLLNSKGYENCAVFVSEKGVAVTISKKDMSNTDIAKINDIIFEETGNNNIKIVEVD